MSEEFLTALNQFAEIIKLTRRKEMFEEFVKALNQLDEIESMTARVGEWTIDISKYGGKRSIEFTRPLAKEEEEE